MNKKILLMFVLIFLIVPFVFAETKPADSAEKGLKWLLKKQGTDGGFNGNVFDTSLSVLAMSSLGSRTEAEKAIDWLKTQQSSQGCFPKNNCRTKDTSLAALALKKFEQDTSKIPDWLGKAQSPALTDSWWLQISSSANGQCRLEYTKNNDQRANISVQVNNSRFPSCGGNNWLDLNACLEPNLIANNPSLNINVDCRALSPSTIISLIYTTSNNYYLVQDEHSPQASIIVKNGCFGIAYR
ncbi:terpene cyclase/mutase family protein [Candidatus Woesearchaeota archaeon]|nr:terpene cyclase/mutase family protein [Candidatus Woesearchaeota archaeon]